MLKECEKIRESLRCNLMSVNEFGKLLEMKFFVYNGCRDKLGRPIMFFLTRNMNLQGVDHDHLKRFFCYQSDIAFASTPPSVDQMIMLVDVHGFGYKNWYVSHFKQAMQFLQIVNAERQYCTCIFRQNLVLKAISSMIKKLLDEGTLAKFRLMGSDYQEQLLTLIDGDNLPVEYGGRFEGLQG